MRLVAWPYINSTELLTGCYPIYSVSLAPDDAPLHTSLFKYSSRMAAKPNRATSDEEDSELS